MKIRKNDVLVLVIAAVVVLIFALVIGRISSLESKVFELERKNFDLEMALLEEQGDHNVDNIKNKGIIKSFVELTAQIAHVNLTDEELGYIDKAFKEYEKNPDQEYADTHFFGAAFYYMYQHVNDVPSELLPELSN